MRSVSTFADKPFTIDDSFIEVTPSRQNAGDPSPLKVKDCIIDDKRYVICYNEDQARKDTADRACIVASLREKLAGSDKNLVGNTGYRKYLAVHGEDYFVVDEQKIADDARFGGIWTLTTYLPDPATEIARHYKELWMVENTFRAMKTVLRTRPIYHQNDGSIRGHVFCSYLAMMLLKELEDRLSAMARSMNGKRSRVIS